MKVFFLGGSPFSREHPLPITINKNTHEKKNDRMKTMLVGGFNLSEKYEFVSWNDDIPIWKNLQKNMEKCSKPPTRMKILVIQKRLKSSESKIMTRWLWSN
jgi:ribosomal protein L18E